MPRALRRRRTGVGSYRAGRWDKSPGRWRPPSVEVRLARRASRRATRLLFYVAYPMRLDLGAANAIQTYSTVRELKRVLSGTQLAVPRWLRERSAFDEIGAMHLPRPAINKLSRIISWAGWSYIERTLYALMLVLLLVRWRVRRRGYRVLYVRDSVCAAWLSLLKGLHGAKVIYEVHDLEASHPSKASKWPRPFWSRFLPWLDRAALTRSDRLVSLTETFRHWVATQHLHPESEVVVIPDAFDPALYYPQDKMGARAVLGLPTDAYIIGYAGLTFAYRRLDLLVEAFASLTKAFPEMVLLLVGGRPDEVTELRTLSEKLGIEPDRLVMPGQVPQDRTALYLNASDVLVIPDTVTAMTASPLKLFEYMATGKPIVCKDMPALREILDDTSARFFESGDGEALADAISRMKLHPDESTELGAEALRRSACYTYQARALQIVEVVKSCL
ncbi:MAG TPA: glycosyltransferase family 4 protein [Chloroflexia bacterium]|nr:glycosyltransferase family 4 protein [Chloroflexia bacterium]